MKFNNLKNKIAVFVLGLLITQLPNYLILKPVKALEPLDTFFTSQSYLTQIHANRAWNEIRESPEIVIAILDTGVDIGNPDLINNIWQNHEEIPGNNIDDDGNGFVDDTHGWDFVQDTNNVRPRYDEGYTKVAMNHGTLVAGVVAAQGGNDVGVAGVTWRAQIMPLRVLDGTGSGDTLTVTKAINYARENGADIINLSFIGSGSSQALALALEKVYNAGIMVIAAAGNEVAIGKDMDLTPMYPVCNDGANGRNWVIGVAAVDNNDRLASFSNFGSKCIDISAPGLGVFSTQFHDPEKYEFRNAYGGFWAGTSVAAPQVAGTAALIRALNPDISLQEWQRILLDNTDNIDKFNAPWLGKFGSGRLNVFKAVSAAKQFSPTAATLKDSFIVTGAGPGGGPHVKLFDPTGLLRLQFFAYSASFTGGTNVLVDDLDSDGDLEIVVAPESDRTPEVKVFNEFGSLLTSFLAYDESFTSGLQIASGDLDGDGQSEIITSPNQGGSPHIRIFNIKGELINEFYAYNKLFKGGANIAVADIDLDGIDDIIVTPGPGATPILKIFDSQGEVKDQFMADDFSQIKGLTVAAWHGNIVVGRMKGNSSVVKYFSRYGKLLSEWTAYHPDFRGGIKVAVADLNGDDTPDIVTVPSSGGGPHLKIFNTSGKVLKQWMSYNPGFRGGISVGLTN